jgi:hypothetical protein
MTPDLVALVEEKLTQEQWSPDQISGRLAQDGVACISHERIYQHVWKDKKDGDKLYLHLRHSGKKYNKRKGKNSGRGLIPNRVIRRKHTEKLLKNPRQFLGSDRQLLREVRHQARGHGMPIRRGEPMECIQRPQNMGIQAEICLPD